MTLAGGARPAKVSARKTDTLMAFLQCGFPCELLKQVELRAFSNQLVLLALFEATLEGPIYSFQVKFISMHQLSFWSYYDPRVHWSLLFSKQTP